MARFNDLFLHNMDEVLQEIFLLLDPTSLHAARQVRASDSSAGWTKLLPKLSLVKLIWCRSCQTCLMSKLSLYTGAGVPSVEPVHLGTTLGKSGGAEDSSEEVGRSVEGRQTICEQQGLLG